MKFFMYAQEKKCTWGSMREVSKDIKEGFLEEVTATLNLKGQYTLVHRGGLEVEGKAIEERETMSSGVAA